MKIVLLTLCTFTLLLSCKKESTPAPALIYPEGRGMIGVVGKDSFNASSMDAHIHYHLSTGKYSMNMGTMDKKSGQIISFFFKDFEYSPKRYELVPRLMGTEDFWYNNFASTTFDNEKFDNNKNGYLSIDKQVAQELIGSFDFSTISNVRIQGTFRYELIYPIDTVE